jgi:hypothetical protein
MQHRDNQLARARRYTNVLIAAALEAARGADRAGRAIDVVRSAWRGATVLPRSVRFASAVLR